MYALTLAVTLKFVPMSRLGAQCYGSWISKRRSVLQIPVTDEKIRLSTTIQLYTTGYKLFNYTTIYNPTTQGGVQLHGHLKIHIVQLLHFRPRVVPYGRYVLPDQLKKNIQHSDPCWRSSKGKSLGKSLGWVTEKMLQHSQPACPDWLLLGQRIHHHYHQVHHIHLPHHHSSAFTTSAASIRVFLGISDIISFLEVLNQTWMSCMYLKNLMSGYTQYFGLTCKYRVYPK